MAESSEEQQRTKGIPDTHSRVAVLFPYAGAVLCVGVIWGLRTALDPLLGDLQPFAIFFLPILFLGWRWGPGPASLAGALGWLVADWFFCTPRYTLFTGGANELTSSLVYFGIAAALVVVTHQMRQARQRTETILHSIADAFCVLDRRGHLTYANPAAERLLRGASAQLPGPTVWEALGGSAEFRQCCEQARSSGQVAHFEHFAPVLNLWLEVHAYPSAEGLSLYLRDITARKHLDEEILRSKERLEQFIREAPVGLAMFNREMRYIRVSNRWLADVGMPAQNVLGKCHYDLFPNLPEHWKQAHRRGLAGETVTGEEDWTAPDGIAHTVRWALHPWGDSGVQTGGIIIYLEDITERKHAEQALRESEERFRTLVDHMSQLAWMVDETGYIFWYNRRWYDYTGTTLAEMQGSGWQRLHHPEHVHRVVDKLAHCFQTGQAWEDTFPLRGKDGRYRWFLSRALPIRDEQGRLVRWFGTSTDITEQKQAEAALRHSEQRYRSFVEATAHVVWRTNARGEVDQPIPAWNAFTGQSAAEAAGFGWTHAIHEEDQPRVAEAWRVASAARAVYQVEYCLKRHDGQWRHILARGVPVLEADGQVREYIGTCIDITEQRQTEAAMQRQARLIDLSPTATLVRRIDGTITFWSDGAERLYGWTRQEALGRRSHDLLRTAFPTELTAILEELRRHGKWSGELHHKTKAGHPIIVESHWLSQCTPAGEVVELLESNMDVTERKRGEQELRRLKDELEQRVAQRTAELVTANKELEAFGYSVSHDLRAPLRHIDSYIKLLEKNAGPGLDEKSQKHLRIVMEAAKRMGHLIDDLLTLSRLGRATMEERPVSLRRLVDEVRQELAPSMAGRAIEWRVGPLPDIKGDPNLLRSALANLLGNAIKYTRQRQPAVIEVGSHEQNGELICFVRDNGAGFDMRFVDKLFGVFQRLHPAQEFEGTGIGLASVRRVIQRHGGRTWAEGELGQGACFYFSLPLSRAVASDAHRTGPAGGD